MLLVNQPKIPKNAELYLKDCLRSTWISSEGKYINKFENAFAKYIGTKYASTTNSGTTALHLALLALGIGKNDEVLLPALTIGSCYFAIWYTGAKAIPIDSEPNTYNINPKLIESKITKDTKAIMVVHLFGHPCKMDEILKIASKYKLKVIEDAAEAHGAEYNGNKVGGLGDIGCFSFYSNKLVTSGEGGMVVCNNKKYYNEINRLKSLNFFPSRKFTHRAIGYKYVMTNLQAAVGLASLEEISHSIKKKMEIVKQYNAELIDIPGITLPSQEPYGKSVYWMFAILVKKNIFGISKRKLMLILRKKYGIQTRDFFFPPQIAFKTMKMFQNQSFPIAEQISKQGMYLPSGVGTKISEIKTVCKAIREISLEYR